MAIITMLGAMLFGYIVGVLQQGIHIHHVKEIVEVEKPTITLPKPESSANLNLMPEDVVKYVQENNGRMNF